MEIKFNQIRQGVTYRGLNNNYSLLYKAVYKGSNWWLMLCCNMDTEVCTSVFMTEKIWNDGCEKCFEEPQTYNNHYFDDFEYVDEHTVKGEVMYDKIVSDE